MINATLPQEVIRGVYNEWEDSTTTADNGYSAWDEGLTGVTRHFTKIPNHAILANARTHAGTHARTHVRTYMPTDTISKTITHSFIQFISFRLPCCVCVRTCMHAYVGACVHASPPACLPACLPAYGSQ